jgi:hypothetical protein
MSDKAKNFSTHFKYLILLIILLDVVYTFKQNYGKPIDGDLVSIVLPTKNYARVLEDPFGISVLLKHEKHSGSNRYFCHEAMHIWFKDVEHVVAFFFKDKTTALYVTSALFNTLVYLFFIVLFAAYASMKVAFKSKEFLVSMLIALPFMQINGFDSIALIDGAVTYTFFYGLALCVLLLYFFPFYIYFISKKTFSFPFIKHAIWILLAVYISFGGTLNQPLILYASAFFTGLFLLKNISQNKQKAIFKSVKVAVAEIPTFIKIHLSFLIILCLYSYYIGMFNDENPMEMPSLYERYLLLLKGIGIHFTINIPYLLFLILLAANYIVLKKISINKQESAVLKFSKYIVLFSIIYIAILPLGGYRNYRPFIIRYDIMSPINILIIFYAIFTSWLIVKYNFNKKYAAFLGVLLFIFIISDKPDFHNNKCQKQKLRVFSTTNEDTIRIDKACMFFQWNTDRNDYNSPSISKMIYEWKISEKPVYFIQE